MPPGRAARHRRVAMACALFALAATACTGRAASVGLVGGGPEDPAAGSAPVDVTVEGGVYASDVDGCGAPVCEVRHVVSFAASPVSGTAVATTTLDSGAQDRPVTADCGPHRFEDATVWLVADATGAAEFDLATVGAGTGVTTGGQVVQQGGTVVCVELVGTWTGDGSAGGWKLVADGDGASLTFGGLSSR